MRKKTIQAENDYDFCVRYTHLLNAVGGLDLTKMEIRAMAGLFLIAGIDTVNVLSTRNQAKISDATGLNPSNLRSLTKRLIAKKLVLKVDRAEGYIPAPLIPKDHEQFQIHLERVRQESGERTEHSQP